MPREPLTAEEVQAVLASGDSSLIRLLSPEERALGANPELTRLQGGTAPDELSRITPVPGRLKAAPAIGAGALGGAMSLATGGLGLPAAVGLVGLAGAGGAGLGLTAKQTMDTNEEPPTVAGNVGTMAKQGALAATGEGVSRGIGLGVQALKEPMKRGARRLMQSAIKPGISEDAPRIVQTMLDEGVNVTENGVRKLEQILGDTNQAIAQEIASTPGAVSHLKVASRLNDTARKFGQQVNPQADLAAISDVGDNFLTHPNLSGAAQSLPDAQAMKVGTYQRLSGKFGELSNATTESEKALARGLKEEIAAQVPGVSALNAREGNILETLEPLERRVMIQGRSNPIGLPAIAPRAIGFITGLVDRHPGLKSALANGLWAQAARMSGQPPDVLKAAVQAILAGQGSDEQTTP